MFIQGAFRALVNGLTREAPVNGRTTGIQPDNTGEVPSWKAREEFVGALELILKEYGSSDGKRLDYERLKGSEALQNLVIKSEALNDLVLQDMIEDEKISLYINAHNALAILALSKADRLKNIFDRVRLFCGPTLQIGEFSFSLIEIASGLLRKNRPNALCHFRPFDEDDKRWVQGASDVDPRRHFALTWGATSCPPLRCYPPADTDSLLTDATKDYLNGPDGVSINSEEGIVLLPSIIKWNEKDFGRNEGEVLDWVSNFLHGELRQKLADIRVQTAPWEVKYATFDWRLNKLESSAS